MHDIVRWNERALEKALKTRRVVVISGARQCGKSTLLEMYFKGKAGAGVGKDDFKHIKWFGDNLAKGRKFTGIVLYAGGRTLSFGEGLKAVPIAALWQ